LEEADCLLGAEKILEKCFSQNIPHRFQLLNPCPHLNQLLLSKHSPPSWKLGISLVAVQHKPHLGHCEPRFLRDFDEYQLLEDVSRVTPICIDQPGRWEHVHAFVVTDRRRSDACLTSYLANRHFSCHLLILPLDVKFT
jgi:hypothetical protein